MTADPLHTLRDIHLPSPSAAWPADSIGWVALAGLVAALALAALAVGWRRRRARRPARVALRALEAAARRHAAGDGDAVALAQAVSRILREQAVRRHPDAGAAGLAGLAWLRFLDRHGGGGAFEHGAGTVLAELPYRAAGSVDGGALVALARQWLEREAP